MNNVERLAEIFGSKLKLAEICEVHKTTVGHWSTHGGDVPAKYHTRIKREAWALTSSITPRDKAEDMAMRIMDCLPGNLCPCCGRPRE